MTVALVVISVVAAACGGAQRRDRPRRELAVAAISITTLDGGAPSLDGDDLRAGLALERARLAGDAFERYAVELDRRRIRAYYVARGYFRAAVTADVARPDREARRRGGAGVDVAFVVDEGPLATLERVEIVGIPEDSGLTQAELRALVSTADGEPFSYEAYDLAKPEVLSALERVGYAYADVDAAVAADVITDRAIIRLELRPGPRCTFGELTVRGVEGPLADAARARLAPVAAGERFSSQALLDARTDLYEMGRFSSVRIEPTLGDEDPVVPVTVTVVESTRHELRLGAGVGVNPTSYEVRGRAGYAVAGFPTPLSRSRVEVRPALVRLRDRPQTEPRVELTAAVERMDLFRPRVHGEIEGTLAYRTVEAFTSVGPGVRVGLRAPLYRRRLFGSVGWRLEYLTFRDIEPALDDGLRAELGIDHANRIGSYEQQVALELRDDPIAPRQGLYVEVRLEEGSALAGGGFEYLQLSPELRGYLPLGPLVLASRLHLGAFVGDVPATRRFFAGGANSQRGFPERRLAPLVIGLDDDGDPVEIVYGGAAILELGAELRAPLGSPRGIDLGGVVFLDGADVRDDLAGLELAQLHWALGAGLRVPTLIGAIRFDVGYRLNRKGPGEPRPDDSFAYHLSIGEAF
ncbi:MAG: BamA/TamA family outer membrane protein [Kofleriaceae bacterium]